MTKQDNKFVVEKAENNVSIYKNEKTIYVFKKETNEINAKEVVDALDVENIDNFDYEINFEEIKKPSPDEVYFNYVFYFLNTLFDSFKPYFSEEKDSVD